VLRRKWKRIEVLTEDASRFAGKCEEGYFLLTRNGARVVSQEGFAQPL
jgi:hypothetical protein